jgi:hypothetical protein
VKAGTAKLLTLFRPATGELRACGVTTATNAVLHPWLKAELGSLVPPDVPRTLDAVGRGTLVTDHDWQPWYSYPLWDPVPPLRVILIWDNLAGHKSFDLVRWLFRHGILPLYTPLGGSWLNMAESIQRIVVRRALAGQHPETPAQIITWLEAAVAGWNAQPTPFVWGGRRQERRQRARLRALGGSAALMAKGNSNAG